jgi:hypothetical protein
MTLVLKRCILIFNIALFNARLWGNFPLLLKKKYVYEITVICARSPLFNHFTDFHETWYEYYVIGGQSTLIYYDSQQQNVLRANLWGGRATIAT